MKGSTFSNRTVTCTCELFRDCAGRIATVKGEGPGARVMTREEMCQDVHAKEGCPMYALIVRVLIRKDISYSKGGEPVNMKYAI